MHRVVVLVAGLALMGVGLVLGMTGHSSPDYDFVSGSRCGSVFFPAKFFSGGYVGERDCEELLDDASTEVYVLLGLGSLVAMAGSAGVITGIRATHRDRHSNQLTTTQFR
jgi:hypothetical protein